MGMMPCAGVLATAIGGVGVIGMPASVASSAAPVFAAMIGLIMSKDVLLAAAAA
jgi:hypothetical protein